MTFQEEWNSWWAPKHAPAVSDPPSIGQIAPKPAKLNIQNNKRTILVFLRHCGCPFAEKTYLQMREAAKTHRDIDFIAISQSTQPSTEKWIKSLPQYGSDPPNLHLKVDHELESFSAYGLGISSWTHVLGYGSMSSVFSLARNEKIANRPTESGSRWQMGGQFGIGQDGKVKWGGPARGAGDIPDFEEAVEAVA